MVIGIAVGRGAFDAMIVLLADVQLAADDWLDSRGLCRIHEMHSAKYVAVVSHSHGGHAEFLDTLTELVHVTSAVKHRIVGVEMKMNELRHSLELNFTLTGFHAKGKRRNRGLVRRTGL